MDLLKQELLKKRQSLAQHTGGRRVFKRSEIEQKQIQKLREEEKIELQAKSQRQSTTTTTTTTTSSQPNSSETNATSTSAATSSASASTASKSLTDEQNIDNLVLPRQEVIRRLRFLKQPITLFGEDDDARLERMKFILKAGLFEVDSDMTEGQTNDFLRDIAELRKRQRTGILSDRKRQKSDEGKPEDRDGGGGEEELSGDGGSSGVDASDKDLKRMKANFEDLCVEDKILVFFKRLLNEWNQELDEMPDAEKRTAKGKSMVATFKQCARYLNPLFKFCRKKIDEPFFCNLNSEILVGILFPILLDCLTMSFPAVASLGYLKSNCTDEELFLSFEKMISGSQFPSNVITDVNPFLYMPSNLPDGIWFFICSEEIKDNKVGFWKTKGNACEIFSNSVITGLRTTLEFYEGQAPHGCKTDWVMHKHRILQREPCEGSKAKEANFLCRVFLGGEQSQNHEMEQKLASSGIQSENYVHLAKSVAAESSIGQSSTSKPQVIEDDSTSRLALAERFPEPWLENLPEVDYLSGGDYMELLDLDNPASPSSSSENSSCVTMSSDGCFDSLALLQDLECGDSQKDVDLKFAVSSSLRPEEGVMFPPTSGSLVTGGRNMLAPEEILNTDCFIPKSSACGQVIDNSFNRAIKNPKTNFGNEGPSSNSRNVTASLNSHIEAPDGENRAGVDRKKNFMKYLCFMAF